MNWADFLFIRPDWLFALLPYLAVMVFLLRRKLSRGNWSSICDAELLPYLLQDKAVKQNRWPLAIGALAAFFAIIAMAGPAWQRLPMPVFRNDSALVIALDLSHSMDAADVKPNRLTLARYKIADILKRRKDGQTALLVFADDAFIVTPLTTDIQTIDSHLSALTTSIMPNDGNNIARALEKAKALFQQAGLQKGQILLMTDGGDVPAGIAQAKSLESYQLLVLGAGTADGAPIALDTGGFLKDEQGNIIIDKLDIPGLKQLAQAGQGIFQALTADDTDIQTLLSAVDSRGHEPGGKEEKLALEQWRDDGPWLLLLVLPLAALSFRRGLLSVAIILILPMPKNSYALEWRDLWQTKDQQAQEAYQQGDFNKAARLFENQDWQAAAEYKSITKSQNQDNDNTEMKESESALGLYNQANVYAVRQDYEKAIGNYAKALIKKPNNELKNDIEFNKKLVEEALQKQQQEKKNQQNQQSKDNKESAKENKNQEQNKQKEQSGQSEQDKEDQKKEEEKQQEQQQQDEQKPEPKPEQSKESTENQPEKQDAKEDKEQDNQSDAAKQEQEQQNEPEQDKKEQDAASKQAVDSMSKEEQQAHEQWLKRIPDDPAGLLKRKFKYQYDQRGRQQ